MSPVGSKPLILIVIDGLTPSMFEGAVGSGETPTLAALAARGTYRRATSVVPSLTPVCLSSIATGAHSDVHEIPHLVWYDRTEQRQQRPVRRAATVGGEVDGRRAEPCVGE